MSSLKAKSLSLFQLRVRKFRRLKRGYYSFLALLIAYVLSFFLPFIMGDRAIVVHYQGQNYYPAFKSYLNQTFGYFSDRVYEAKTFGQPAFLAQVDYRKLAKKFDSPAEMSRLLREQRILTEAADPGRIGEGDASIQIRLRLAQRQAQLAVELERSKVNLEDIDDALALQPEAVVSASEASAAILQGRYDEVRKFQKEVEDKLQEMLAEIDKAPDIKGNSVLMPIVPYSPMEQFEGSEERPQPPNPPSRAHPLGTDDRGRDIMVRLAYGFRVSMSFAILVTFLEYLVGTIIGAVLGYFGKWVDLLGVRFVEIWASIPVLYTIMILADRMGRSFPLLVLLLAGFSWIGIAFYVRGEFLREKAKDYVAAARAVGEGEMSIMFRHILPNALTPIIAFAPFAIVGNISALLALDYLGFGLPTGTPSWGELIGQGKAQITQWYLIVFPIAIVFITLQLIVFIGEAVREAFDPKVFSKLQ